MILEAGICKVVWFLFICLTAWEYCDMLSSVHKEHDLEITQYMDDNPLVVPILGISNLAKILSGLSFLRK